MGATPIFGGHKTGEILALGAYKMLGNIKLYLWGLGRCAQILIFAQLYNNMVYRLGIGVYIDTKICENQFCYLFNIFQRFKT